MFTDIEVKTHREKVDSDNHTKISSTGAWEHSLKDLFYLFLKCVNN